MSKGSRSTHKRVYLDRQIDEASIYRVHVVVCVINAVMQLDRGPLCSPRTTAPNPLYNKRSLVPSRGRKLHNQRRTTSQESLLGGRRAEDIITLEHAGTSAGDAVDDDDLDQRHDSDELRASVILAISKSVDLTTTVKSPVKNGQRAGGLFEDDHNHLSSGYWCIFLALGLVVYIFAAYLASQLLYTAFHVEDISQCIFYVYYPYSESHIQHQ
eukprot:2634155-Pyramimonas_sp.AAC.1